MIYIMRGTFKSQQNMRMIKPESRNEIMMTRTLIPYKEKLCIATQNGHIFIKKKEILFLGADSNYCSIHVSGSKLVCSQTIKKVASRLHSSKFLRVHQSYVVNLTKIKSINSAFTNITMEDDTIIPIARTKKQSLKLALENQCD